MRIGVLGINHKLADLKLREQLAKACQRRFGAENSLHCNHHFILLSTCNRTEVYFCSEDLAATHTYLLNILRNDVDDDFDHKLYSFFGVDCFLHLSRVASGLDSAIIAETEIQGQVKSAYEHTLSIKTLPKELHFLFQKTLGISKKVRTDLQLGRGMPNLEHAIFHVGKHFFKSKHSPRVLFIGISQINQKILHFLKSKKLESITLCNRTEEKASTYAETMQINFLPWSHLSQWNLYDWVILGTKAPDYLIKREMKEPTPMKNQLIMDLSVPRNVDPYLSREEGITLMNIDQINRLLKIRHRACCNTLKEAEERITQAAQAQVSRYQEREKSKINIFAVTA